MDLCPFLSLFHCCAEFRNRKEVVALVGFPNEGGRGVKH